MPAPTPTPTPPVPTPAPTLPLPTTTPSVTPEPSPTPPPTAELTVAPTTRVLAPPTEPPRRSVSPRPTTATQFVAPPHTDPVLVGAGDIAVCGAEGDEATAKLLDSIPGTVFTLGDNVYPNGTLEQFHACYEPSWGRHKARTKPVPGNHDYNTAGAAGYYAYFGTSAGEPDKGYYSYDLGAWHIVVLNSEIETGADSVQVQWLRDDLVRHPAQCTLAMFHRPLFSSGPHGYDGSGDKTRPLWQVLYENNADVILNGHDHDYERFAPQDPQGQRDEARGIRQFVVGTGGAVPYIFGELKPNSEIQRAGQFGVLRLVLHDGSYEWTFLPVTGILFRDSGRGECH